MTHTETLRLALEALEVANSLVDGYYLPKEKAWLPEIEEAITAIKAALEAKDEPVAWATREDFYRELEHAMNRMRQQMKIKSVTMRCTDYDLALPIIDIFDGRILVGQVITPPQRKPLTDEQIMEALGLDGYDSMAIENARAIEAAHGIK